MCVCGGGGDEVVSCATAVDCDIVTCGTHHIRQVSPDFFLVARIITTVTITMMIRLIYREGGGEGRGGEGRGGGGESMNSEMGGGDLEGMTHSPLV